LKEIQPSQLSLPDFSQSNTLNAPEILVTETKPSSQPVTSEPPPQASQAPQNNSQGNSQYNSRENSYYGYQTGSQDQSRENSYHGQQGHSGQQTRETSYNGQQGGYSGQQTRENSYYDQQYGYQQYDDYYQGHDQNHDDGEDYYDPAEEYEDWGGYEDYGYDPRRMTMGMRPLPPDDPSENPEQRANRIRSFYKEYFDAPNGAYQQQAYYDGSEYYDDYYYDDQYQPPRGHSSAGGRHRGHTYSNGSYAPGPRAYSSASGRYGHPGRFGPRKPKKQMPPPKALTVLPTPAKLKDDTFLIDQSIDFAPPSRIFAQRAGTPDSLRGEKRPYSPTVRAHIPLASSFDDLSAMPSP
jgi:hypothetical protein